MGDNTTIAWTDATFNPWWGCVKISPGCTNCYADAFDHRLGGTHWGKNAERRFFGAAHWKQLLDWNAAAEKAGVRKRVFIASMCDVFEDREDLVAPRTMLWNLAARTPWLDKQLLTKRPQNIVKMVPPAWLEKPLSHVWYGTSVEDQQRAEERIPELLRVPAAVRFLSCEPLLGPVDLGRVGSFRGEPLSALECVGHVERPRVDWVIVGGESGAGARPCNVESIRRIVSDCRAARVACFVKQLGARPVTIGTPPFGLVGGDVTIVLTDRKGGDTAEWPTDLRVREFPRSAA